MDEAIVCSDCLAEPAPDLDGKPELEGWDLDAEFGPRCIECVAENTAPTQSEGIDGVAAGLGASKESK